MISGIIFAFAAAIAVTWLVWVIGSRSGESPLFGIFLGMLVLAAGVLRSLGL